MGKRRDCLQPKGPEVPELVTIVVLERMAEDLRDCLQPKVGDLAGLLVAAIEEPGQRGTRSRTPNGSRLVELGHRLSLSGARAARQA